MAPRSMRIKTNRARLQVLDKELDKLRGRALTGEEAIKFVQITGEIVELEDEILDMQAEDTRMSRGMMIAIGIIIGTVLVIVGSSVMKDIERVQKFRTQFASDCAVDYGYVIRLRSGGNKQYMCVGPDGRILRSY